MECVGDSQHPGNAQQGPTEGYPSFLFLLTSEPLVLDAEKAVFDTRELGGRAPKTPRQSCVFTWISVVDNNPDN